MVPQGREKRHLEVEKKRRKNYCAAPYHTTCLWEVIETDACALAPSFQDSQEIDGCLPKPLKQL